MSKLLAQLLKTPEPIISRVIFYLEEASGHPKIDIKLTEEIRQKTNKIITELGLDENDTLAPELFQSLKQKAIKDDQVFISYLKLAHLGDSDVLGVRLTKQLNSSFGQNKLWAIKKSVAKNLFLQLPPKQTMKLLGYRSTASLVKNEPIDELIAVTNLLEDIDWKLKYKKLYLQLDQGDTELTNLRFVYLDSKKWKLKDLGLNKYNQVISSPEMAVIGLSPIIKVNIDGFSLVLLNHIYIQCLKTWSASFRLALNQFNGHFSELLYELAMSPGASPISISGQKIDWPTLLLAISKDKTKFQSIIENCPDLSGLMVNYSDFCERLEPSLSWWRGLDYCGVHGSGRVVSLNFSDITYDIFKNETAHSSSVIAMRSALQRELLARYSTAPVFVRQIAKQLDNITPSLETISVSTIKIKRRKTNSKSRNNRKAD